MQTVKENGTALKYAHEDLQKDKELVLEAVKEDGSALKYAHEDLQKDKEVVLEAAKKYSFALQYAHEDLQKDKEFVLEAVKVDGLALKYVHEDLQRDKEFVLEAVKEESWSLRFVHEDLKKDRPFILEAVKLTASALHYAHEDLKKDRAFVLEAVKLKASALRFAKKEFKPFLKAYVQLNQKSDLGQNDLKNAIKQIIQQCEQLFISDQESPQTLAEVLKKTNTFLSSPGNKSVVNDYGRLTIQIHKSPGLKLLGKLMMGLAVVLLGVSIAMAATGVGLLPAAGLAAASVGLFSSGFIVNKEPRYAHGDLMTEINGLTDKVNL